MADPALISYLDTNAVIFLHSGQIDRISHRAQEQIENSDLLISPMVMLELSMLHDKGVLRYDSSMILANLSQDIGLSVCQLPMSAVVAQAVTIRWTREPGDLLIVANAMANNGAPLITSDVRLRSMYLNAIW